MQGQIYINPEVVNDQRDALAVAYNEAYRIIMEQQGFEPQAEPTPEQVQFFSDTAYANDPLMMKRTITARIATYDGSVPNPTPEQYQDVVDMLNMVMESGVIQNDEEESIVTSTLQDMEAEVQESQGAAQEAPQSLPPEMGGALPLGAGGEGAPPEMAGGLPPELMAALGGASGMGGEQLMPQGGEGLPPELLQATRSGTKGGAVAGSTGVPLEYDPTGQVKPRMNGASANGEPAAVPYRTPEDYKKEQEAGGFIYPENTDEGKKERARANFAALSDREKVEAYQRGEVEDPEDRAAIEEALSYGSPEGLDEAIVAMKAAEKEGDEALNEWKKERAKDFSVKVYGGKRTPEEISRVQGKLLKEAVARRELPEGADNLDYWREQGLVKEGVNVLGQKFEYLDEQAFEDLVNSRVGMARMRDDVLAAAGQDREANAYKLVSSLWSPIMSYLLHEVNRKSGGLKPSDLSKARQDFVSKLVAGDPGAVEALRKHAAKNDRLRPVLRNSKEYRTHLEPALFGGEKTHNEPPHPDSEIDQWLKSPAGKALADRKEEIDYGDPSTWRTIDPNARSRNRERLTVTSTNVNKLANRLAKEAPNEGGRPISVVMRRREDILRGELTAAIQEGNKDTVNEIVGLYRELNAIPSVMLTDKQKAMRKLLRNAVGPMLKERETGDSRDATVRSAVGATGVMNDVIPDADYGVTWDDVDDASDQLDQGFFGDAGDYLAGFALGAPVVDLLGGADSDDLKSAQLLSNLDAIVDSQMKRKPFDQVYSGGLVDSGVLNMGGTALNVWDAYQDATYIGNTLSGVSKVVPHTSALGKPAEWASAGVSKLAASRFGKGVASKAPKVAKLLKPVGTYVLPVINSGLGALGTYNDYGRMAEYPKNYDQLTPKQKVVWRVGQRYGSVAANKLADDWEQSVYMLERTGKVAEARLAKEELNRFYEMSALAMDQEKGFLEAPYLTNAAERWVLGSDVRVRPEYLTFAYDVTGQAAAAGAGALAGAGIASGPAAAAGWYTATAIQDAHRNALRHKYTLDANATYSQRAFKAAINDAVALGVRNGDWSTYQQLVDGVDANSRSQFEEYKNSVQERYKATRKAGVRLMRNSLY